MNIFKLMNLAGELEKRGKRARERIQNLSVQVKSPDGKIQVEVGGTRQITAIRLAEDTFTLYTPEALAEQLRTLVNDALTTLDMQIVEILQDEFREVAEIFPNFTGMLGLPTSHSGEPKN